MKFYNLESKFTFGKFEGQTLREVIDVESSYLDWCSLNLDHFYISPRIIQEITTIVPNFTISEEGKNKLAEKYKVYEQQMEQEQDEKQYYHEDSHQSADENPYYNDALDMDQQSSEFWDNL